MTEEQLMRFMRAVDTIPFCDRSGQKRRTIYEAGRGALLQPSGRFFMDFATYGGTTERVPKMLIDRLEREGKLVRAFPDSPHINAWELA